MQIKTQSLAMRCEICHQTDCYDAKDNYCSRCWRAATQLKNKSLPNISSVDENLLNPTKHRVIFKDEKVFISAIYVYVFILFVLILLGILLGYLLARNSVIACP